MDRAKLSEHGASYCKKYTLRQCYPGDWFRHRIGLEGALLYSGALAPGGL
jgi:hypothetical protein